MPRSTVSSRVRSAGLNPAPARLRRSLVPLGLLLAVALLAASCGSDDGDLKGRAATVYGGSCEDGTGASVTVYSGRSESLIGPVLEAFECETGISVRVRWDSSTNLALLLGEEGDRTDADVFISRSPGPVGFVEARGLLAPMSSDVLNLVAPENRSSVGTWIGFSGRHRVLVYNVDNVPAGELPASVFDLTDPAYRGRVAIPASNGSFLDWFTVFRDQQGDETASRWLNDMADNDARFYPNNRAIVEAVGRGEIDMGLVNHYYNFQQAAAEGDGHRALNHDFAADDIGSLLIITAAGVTTTTGDVASAERLVAYLLSEPVQRYFTDETFEYPLGAGVSPNPVLPPLAGLSAGTVNFDTLGGSFAGSEDIIQRSDILNQ